MFDTLLRLVGADLKRQGAWIRAQIKRQARYGAFTAAFAAVGTLAVVGAIAVGLIALYSWAALRYGHFPALGIVGGALLVLAAILFTLAFARDRPKFTRPPAVQSASPAVLLGTLKQSAYGDAVAAGEQAWRTAEHNLRHGSRQSLYGTLALAAVVGVILGRRL